MTADKADAQAIASRPFLITFSGIDGAGKTTQIEYLASSLQEQGLRVQRLSFWDDVAVWSNMRSGVGQRTAKTSGAGETAEPSFSPRNNKHIRKWYLTGARLGFYMLDAMRLRWLLTTPRATRFDVIIFDRYIYDQIANFYSRSFAARFYSKMLLSQTPTPDLAFIIDASPSAAFARKAEYPLDFVVKNRQTFLDLGEIVPQLIIISPAAAEEVRREIDLHVRRTRLSPGLRLRERLQLLWPTP
jgi:thymidylate kinase